MKVYVFGNQYLKEDSLAKEIIRGISINGVEFINCEGPDDIFLEEETIVILDVAQNIDEVLVLDDLSKLESSKLYSLHDFDLSYFLKLMKSTGQLKNVKIIAIPQKGDKNAIQRKIVDSLKYLSSLP